MLPKLPKMKSKNKQKKNNEVPTIMDEHTSVMIGKEEEDEDVNNNGDDEEEDYDEDDVDENVNTSEDEMELFVKLYNIVTNVRRVAFIQLTTFFVLLIVSATVSKRYAWTKAVHTVTFLIFNLETILWIKTFSSIYPTIVGIYSWYYDTFQKPCLHISLYRHFIISSFIDLIFSLSLFFTTINAYHHKIKSVMPFAYFAVSFLLSLFCSIGNGYILTIRKMLLIYDDDEYGGGIYSTISPDDDDEHIADDIDDMVEDELETNFNTV